MKNIDVVCTITERTDIGGDPIRVKNDVNNDSIVIIEAGGKEYKVDGEELKMAVNKCMRWN